MPDWVLTTSYALHMLATVLWIGGLIFQALFLLPLLTQDPLDTTAKNNLSMLQTRFQPLAWLSLAVLFGTGLTQMAAHPQYEGLLTVQNRWSLAILAKHLSILPMLAVTGFQSFVLHPRLQRELLRSRSAGAGPILLRSLRSERRLVVLNAFFSIAVLIFTAFARTS
ncbi:MAG: CopD family protein [Anaerolineales bacterium]|nr:CopD family protein [Anaerolineales bacterium]